jgi:hypothetical protein
MPTRITLIHADDFIRLTPDGTVDVEASRKILTELVSTLKATGEDRALIDLRKTTAALSKPELIQLATAFGTQSILTRTKIVLLVSLSRQTDAEFFEAVARLEGIELRAFTDFENAITWLVMREQPIRR